MFCPMEPPISDSIVRLNEEHFRLGSSRIVERSNALDDSSIIAHWQADGVVWVLREASEIEIRMPPSSSKAMILYEAGHSVCVFQLSERISCTVKSWCENFETEADTIEFVHARCPSIPVPDILCSWIDHARNRSYLIFREKAGLALTRQWNFLSESQRAKIAREVAKFCKELSQITSDKLESAKHKAVMNYHLNNSAPTSHPTWKPWTLGPFSIEEFTNFLRGRTPAPATDIPALGDTFHFAHLLLGPDGIKVNHKGEITEIRDWDIAGFYPKFTIALMPHVSYAYYLPPLYFKQDASGAWVRHFQAALAAEGFENSKADQDWYRSLKG